MGISVGGISVSVDVGESVVVSGNSVASAVGVEVVVARFGVVVLMVVSVGLGARGVKVGVVLSSCSIITAPVSVDVSVTLGFVSVVGDRVVLNWMSVGVEPCRSCSASDV